MTTRRARSWLAVFGTATVASLLIVGGVEIHYRAQGVPPTVLDDADLWSQERARLARAGARSIALLGTSRTVFGIDPQRLQSHWPDRKVVMLALNAAYPMATLRDLALDPDFKGWAVVETDAAGLRSSLREMQQPQINHYHRQFGPARALNRRLLSYWQVRMVTADPTYGALASLQRALTGNTVQVRYAVIAANRAGQLDFRRADAAGLAAHFAQGREQQAVLDPPPPPSQWRADLAPVTQWVNLIQARGGKVLFFAAPTSGRLRIADELAYPNQAYWATLEALVGAPAVHANHLPELRDLATPDGSHVDRRDRGRLTDALAAVLRDRFQPGSVPAMR